MLKVMGIRPDGSEFYCFHFEGHEVFAVIKAFCDCARYGIEICDVRVIPVSAAHRI